MPAHGLRELGWDTRRLRILLTLPEWEWIDAKATALNCDAAAVVSLLVRVEHELTIARNRYALTPKGEAAAAEPTADLDPARWGKGGTEW
jgi:hypothetical protein